ncbi:MAG: cation diffusion facilitator family transporter [Sulfurimonas sp.]|jgi:cobalt-zinc-cadmium efflux system protein|nr:cation diffusion facilitator family transporter [Sulfurimonas sp.]
MEKSKKQTLQKVILLNIVLVIAEIGAGIFSGSMALIADAFHNLGDVLALFISLVAIIFGAKEVSSKMTFGYIKAEMMAAFVNSLFLVITMLFILFESLTRLYEPHPIDAPIVIIASLLALFVNGYSTYLLRHNGVEHHHHHDHEDHHHEHEDLNMRSAYLHMLGDAVISLSVAIGGVLIYFFGIISIDTILSILFSIYIIKETFPLLKRSFFALMDSSGGVDVEAIETILLQKEMVSSVHDLHIYTPSSKGIYGSVHLVLCDNFSLVEIEGLLEEIRADLAKIGIKHFIMQPETQKYLDAKQGCKSH